MEKQGKLCPRCNTWKESSLFGTRNGHISSYCRKCNKEYMKEYNYNRKNTVAIHASQLKHYGYSIEMYDKMYKKQKGLCAICKQPETSPHQKHLSIDHCHKDLRIRGLLCNNCNRGIGLLGDDPEIVLAAYYYLYKS